MVLLVAAAAADRTAVVLELSELIDGKVCYFAVVVVDVGVAVALVLVIGTVGGFAVVDWCTGDVILHVVVVFAT